MRFFLSSDFARLFYFCAGGNGIRTPDETRGITFAKHHVGV
jgi:hypothetical protein